MKIEDGGFKKRTGTGIEAVTKRYQQPP